ncbi:MAG: hypothetical protein VX403_11395 [Planctomycetota bacterium]|nr:hypothetical protein [Planctomycetota bacterium]
MNMIPSHARSNIAFPLLALVGLGLLAPCGFGDDEGLEAVLRTFGPGVVVPREGAVSIPEIASFFDGELGTRTFTVVVGNDRGTDIDITVQEDGKAADSHVLRIGDLRTTTVLVRPDGLYRSIEVDHSTKSIATFKPDEPVCLVHAVPGEPVRASIQVSVSSVDDPDKTTHQGTLECVYEVLGAFTVNSPAGKFQTTCIRTSYRGSVGPAEIDDAQYVFFAPRLGPVAIRSFDHVKAMIVYDKTQKASLLLKQYRGQAAPDPGSGPGASK